MKHCGGFFARNEAAVDQPAGYRLIEALIQALYGGHDTRVVC
jgi:hypothetical protein